MVSTLTLAATGGIIARDWVPTWRTTAAFALLILAAAAGLIWWWRRAAGAPPPPPPQRQGGLAPRTGPRRHKRGG